MLLVGEERGEGVEGAALHPSGHRTPARNPGKVGVDETKESGQIGAADGGGGGFAEGVPGGFVGWVVAFDGGGEVLIAEVEDGEADLLGLFCDAGAEGGAAESDAAAAGG